MNTMSLIADFCAADSVSVALHKQAGNQLRHTADKTDSSTGVVKCQRRKCRLREQLRNKTEKNFKQHWSEKNDLLYTKT